MVLWSGLDDARKKGYCQQEYCQYWGLTLEQSAAVRYLAFGSGWTLSVCLLVIIFIKSFSILLQLWADVFQFSHHRQYLFVGSNTTAGSII